MNEQEQEQEQDKLEKSFFKTLAEIINTETAIIGADCAQVVDPINQLINTHLNNTISYAETQAEKYGANTEAISSIMEEYKATLNSLKSESRAEFDNINANLASLRSNRIEAYKSLFALQVTTREAIDKHNSITYQLRSELSKYIKEGNPDAVSKVSQELVNHLKYNPKESKSVATESLKKYIEELNASIEKCETDIEEAKKDSIRKIKEATESKEKKLSEIPKQSFFDKTIGRVFNRINGAKKFAKNVINPLKDRITELKEEKLPELKESSDKKILQFKKKFSDITSSMKKAVQIEMNETAKKLAEQRKAVIDNLKATMEQISYNVNEAKDIVEGTEKKVGDFFKGTASTVAEITDEIIKSARENYNNIKRNIGTSINYTVESIKSAPNKIANKFYSTETALALKAQKYLDQRLKVLAEKQSALTQSGQTPQVNDPEAEAETTSLQEI